MNLEYITEAFVSIITVWHIFSIIIFPSDWSLLLIKVLFTCLFVINILIIGVLTFGMWFFIFFLYILSPIMYFPNTCHLFISGVLCKIVLSRFSEFFLVITELDIRHTSDCYYLINKFFCFILILKLNKFKLFPL